jgi:hypothetical protein
MLQFHQIQLGVSIKQEDQIFNAGYVQQPLKTGMVITSLGENSMPKSVASEIVKK